MLNFTEIDGKNAAGQSEHPDQASAFTPTAKHPSGWTHCLGNYTTADPKQWVDSRSVLRNRVKHMRNIKNPQQYTVLGEMQNGPTHYAGKQEERQARRQEGTEAGR